MYLRYSSSLTDKSYQSNLLAVDHDKTRERSRSTGHPTNWLYSLRTRYTMIETVQRLPIATHVAGNGRILSVAKWTMWFGHHNDERTCVALGLICTGLQICAFVNRVRICLTAYIMRTAMRTVSHRWWWIGLSAIAWPVGTTSHWIDACGFVLVRRNSCESQIPEWIEQRREFESETVGGVWLLGHA